MRYISLILSTAALAGCSASGLGGPYTNNCAPNCATYAAPTYAAPTYAAPAYATPTYAAPTYTAPTYSQAAYHPTYPQYDTYQPYPQVETYPVNQPTIYAQNPTPYFGQAYAQGQTPQLRGLSNAYSPRAYKYGSLGAILYDFDSEKFGVQGRVGYQSAGILGAELEGSISLGSDTEELNVNDTPIVRGFTDPALTPGTSTLRTEFTNSIAAFGVARLPLSDRFSIHSRAGLHSTRFEAELDDGVQVLKQNETSFGIAYGAGMNFSVTPNNDIRLDYTVYDNDAGGNADSLAVAFAHKF